MLKEFDNIASAFSEFQSEPSIKTLYYDDLKRKIVIDRPKHTNQFLLVERGNDIDIGQAIYIAIQIATWHVEQYAEDILKRAEQNPLSYNELFTYLNDELRIFYDAAKIIDNWILQDPARFGLEAMMHQEKSLCFIPIREH